MGISNANIALQALPTSRETIREREVGAAKVAQIGSQFLEGQQTGFENELLERKDARAQRVSDIKIIDGMVKTLLPAAKQMARFSPEGLDAFFEDVKSKVPEFNTALGNLKLENIRLSASAQNEPTFKLPVKFDESTTLKDLEAIATLSGISLETLKLFPQRNYFLEFGEGGSINFVPEEVEEGAFVSTPFGTLQTKTGETRIIKKPEDIIKSKQRIFNVRNTLRQNFQKDDLIKSTVKVLSSLGKVNKVLLDIETFNNLPENAENKRKLGILDQVLITSFQKMIDDGSTVREGEFARAKEAVPLVDKGKSIVARITQGTDLTPTLRQEMIDVSRGFAQGQFNLTKGLTDDANAEARKAGVDTKGILGGFLDVAKLAGVTFETQEVADEPRFDSELEALNSGLPPGTSVVFTGKDGKLKRGEI